MEDNVARAVELTKSWYDRAVAFMEQSKGLGRRPMSDSVENWRWAVATIESMRNAFGEIADALGQEVVIPDGGCSSIEPGVEVARRMKADKENLKKPWLSSDRPTATELAAGSELRDRFAMAALGVMAISSQYCEVNVIARRAYKIADAMLAARGS